jgi:hypothetical protein
MAGIKIHAAIDMLVKNNRIHGAGRGIWMDWMAQGTRITANLCYDNSTDDLFVEVNHGPFLVDNNLLLSGISLFDMSEGGAFAHNLIGGQIISQPEPRRSTPFHSAHSTAVAGLIPIQGGDNRFYNNLFTGDGKSTAGAPQVSARDSLQAAGFGLWVYDAREAPLQTGGNIYYGGARPSAGENNPNVATSVHPGVQIAEEGRHVFLRITTGGELTRTGTSLVTTNLLGKARVSGLPYENADGSPLSIDTDYFGRRRNLKRPSPGPFERLRSGTLSLKVW